ncbi:MAG: hypothetical protein LBN71_03745 [Tannerella sp.]|nr:hypothetical protein [Tannerella sp.]
MSRRRDLSRPGTISKKDSCVNLVYGLTPAQNWEEFVVGEDYEAFLVRRKVQ